MVGGHHVNGMGKGSAGWEEGNVVVGVVEDGDIRGVGDSTRAGGEGDGGQSDLAKGRETREEWGEL